MLSSGFRTYLDLPAVGDGKGKGNGNGNGVAVVGGWGSWDEEMSALWCWDGAWFRSIDVDMRNRPDSTGVHYPRHTCLRSSVSVEIMVA